MSDRPRLAPLCGFLVLLAVVFAVSYGVGAAVGPDEADDPGVRRPGTVTETGTETHDMGDMRDMHSGGHG
ncbi:hypothetical protein ABZ916_33015 [Streptomyces sp. NPDC046853]|uniref:hypothetical protein n=1 Tax=Streptomyces sp. NPDC046853 TaxID=3154920 RepID=UPI0034105C87